MTTTDGRANGPVILITALVAVVTGLPALLITWGLLRESEALVAFGVVLTRAELVPIARGLVGVVSSGLTLALVALLAGIYVVVLFDIARSRFKSAKENTMAPY